LLLEIGNYLPIYLYQKITQSPAANGTRRRSRTL